MRSSFPRVSAFIGLLLAIGAPAGAQTTAPAAPPPALTAPLPVPQLTGKWIQIAPNAPDVGNFATGQQNACDFTIFPDNAGTWHLISCIRGTSAPGQRVFFQWHSDQLTAPDWIPDGLFNNILRGDRGKPPAPSSVQAPHELVYHDTHYLFYNSGGAAYCLTSPDGDHWTQAHAADGSPRFFSMGRDVNIFRDAPHDRWIAYYCGTATVGGQRRGAMVARTATDLKGPWSNETPVLTVGNPESPFVVYHAGHYYLWQQMSVYVSDDPLKFNAAPLVAHMTGVWFGGKYAPEIVRDGDAWYIAGYSRGIHLSKMEWVTKTPEEIATWRTKWHAYLAEQAKLRQEREAARERASTQP